MVVVASSEAAIVGLMLRGWGGLPWAPFALALATSLWPALTLVEAAIGAFLLVPDPPAGRPRSPTTDGAAIAIPIRDECLDELAAGLLWQISELERGGLGGLPLYVLSDTADDGTAERERSLIAALGRNGAPLTYVRRRQRAYRKHGNLLAFLNGDGRGYSNVLLLDADSRIAAKGVWRLLAEIASDPALAVVQSVPYPAGQQSLFSRWLQFGAWLYTPGWARARAWWQRDGAGYWGHNAILNADAFRAEGPLPMLPGGPPLGGEILSHDAAEAARLLRRGWRLRLLPLDVGSRETVPSNLLDSLSRERRWCEGNLQNLHAAAGGGFAAVGLVLDAAYYLRSVADVAMAGLLVYATGTLGLVRPLVTLVVLRTFAVLFKVASAAPCLLDSRRARWTGGRAPLLLSLLLEIVVGFVAQPISTTANLVAVAQVLLGRTSGWGPQHRGDRETGWGEALRSVGPMSLAALAAVAAIAVVIGTAAAVVLSAAAIGPLLAVPFAVLGGRVDLGLAALGRRVFLVGDEVGGVGGPI